MKNIYGFEAVPKIIGENDYRTIYCYLNKSLVPWADVSVQVECPKKEILTESSEFDPPPHTHQTIETYVVIGDLCIEVDIEGEKHTVCSPGTIVIPPGVKRCRRYLKGSGFVITILRIPEEPKTTGWPET